MTSIIKYSEEQTHQKAPSEGLFLNNLTSYPGFKYQSVDRLNDLDYCYISIGSFSLMAWTMSLLCSPKLHIKQTIIAL